MFKFNVKNAVDSFIEEELSIDRGCVKIPS